MQAHRELNDARPAAYQARRGADGRGNSAPNRGSDLAEIAAAEQAAWA
jgi:hypothetical protein